MVLTPEDFEKYKMQFVPVPRSDEASRAQELANKCREQTKLENQMKHYQGVISDLENKLVKHRILLSDLEIQHKEISQEIAASRAEVAQPPPAPPVESTPVIEEVIDTDMGEEDHDDLSCEDSGPLDEVPTAGDDGAIVGFITVQPRKKVKKAG